jgi:hypothetical protein
MTVIAIGLVAACAAGAVLVEQAVSATDGDSVAADLAQDRADELNTRLGYRNRPRAAESIAATEVVTATAHPELAGPAQVAVLAWSGQVRASEKATIDVRFTATVEGTGLLWSGHTAGSATRCYRYTLQYYRYTEHREIRCPTVADLPVPSAAPVPKLPGDAADRLAAALRTATPETLEDSVRSAFPQEGLKVETETTDGTLVAAVGVPAERDCVVVIRRPDGDTRQIGFDRVQLEPGETGCGTALYTRPAR